MFPAHSFPDTTEYNKFFKEMREWVFILADAIKNAPKWNEDWLTNQWLDEPYEQLKIQTEQSKSNNKPIL